MSAEFQPTNLPEKVLSADGTRSANDAFEYLKKHFGLEVDRDHSVSPVAIDASRHSESETELIGDRQVHATLSERMVKRGGLGYPEEIMVVTVTSREREERGVLTSCGMISFNYGPALTMHEQAENFRKQIPGYPFGGWRDADRSRDPLEFRRGIFDVQDMIRGKYKIGNIIKSFIYKINNSGRVRQ